MTCLIGLLLFFTNVGLVYIFTSFFLISQVITYPKTMYTKSDGTMWIRQVISILGASTA